MEGVDRLRDWFEGAYSYGSGDKKFERTYKPWFGWKGTLEPMLDDIEREHEMALKTDADSTSYQLGYMAGRAAAMMAAANREETELFGVGYVPLPVDRDGVAIRPGDTLETCDGGTPLSCEVRYVAWDGEDWAVEEFFDKAPNFYGNFRDMCHAKKATVEDTLREFALACEDAGNAGPEVERIVAEYAAKLRMAE